MGNVRSESETVKKGSQIATKPNAQQFHEKIRKLGEGGGREGKEGGEKGGWRGRGRSVWVEKIVIIDKNNIYMIQVVISLINRLFELAMGAELQSNKKPKIHFIMRKQLDFGKSLYVVGNIEQLGCWQVDRALRLSWNKNHFWTGFIELPPAGLGKPIEFKYAVADWDTPGCSTVEWEAGSANRLIELPGSRQHVICENAWNMEKITLNLMVPESFRNQEYFVTGDCKELGNWKKSLKMRENHGKNVHDLQKLEHLGQGKKYIIYSVSFQIFRAKTKIRYSYIRKTQDYEIERHPCRKYQLSLHSNSHPKCLKIAHTNGDTQMFQICNFQQLNYSSVTNNILIGPYLKNSQDFMVLQKQGVSSILSIQTSEDIAQHSITEDFLHQQSEKYGMQLFNYSIQDMNKVDFLSKYLGAIKLLKKLVAEDKKVYVHCTAGVYRSPQVVSLFLVLTQNLSADQAIRYVKSRHPYARPNYKLISQALLLLFQVKNLMA